MRIGITVVYMVSKRSEKVLDLHFRQIEKNTESPYKIYACVNTLLPEFHKKLEQNSHVKICQCETYVKGSGFLRQDRTQVAAKGPADMASLDSKYEHSWYLEQLIRAAIEDGVSHVVILHVDSFPVRSGWEIELISKFSDRCMLAGITRDKKIDYKPLTACILFTRDFYVTYQPRLLLSQEEFDSENYKRYREACPHVTDSGFGYGFKMFMEGLIWYPLVRSNHGRNLTLFASIYGDLIFHLHATAFVERTKTVGFRFPASTPARPRGSLMDVGALLVRPLLPTALRQRIRRYLSQQIRKKQESKDWETWEQERRRLFEDPDAYLMYLRTGIG